MNLFKTKYRIVSDNYQGFEAQFRYWWWFWMAIGGLNSRPSLEGSKKLVERHKNCVVWKE